MVIHGQCCHFHSTLCFSEMLVKQDRVRLSCHSWPLWEELVPSEPANERPVTNHIHDCHMMANNKKRSQVHSTITVSNSSFSLDLGISWSIQPCLKFKILAVLTKLWCQAYFFCVNQCTSLVRKPINFSVIDWWVYILLLFTQNLSFNVLTK